MHLHIHVHQAGKRWRKYWRMSRDANLHIGSAPTSPWQVCTPVEGGTLDTKVPSTPKVLLTVFILWEWIQEDEQNLCFLTMLDQQIFTLMSLLTCKPKLASVSARGRKKCMEGLLTNERKDNDKEIMKNGPFVHWGCTKEWLSVRTWIGHLGRQNPSCYRGQRFLSAA